MYHVSNTCFALPSILTPGCHRRPNRFLFGFVKVMDFGVGIITPDWLKDATYLGEEPCGIYQ